MWTPNQGSGSGDTTSNDGKNERIHGIPGYMNRTKWLASRNTDKIISTGNDNNPLENIIKMLILGFWPLKVRRPLTNIGCLDI